MNISNKIYKAAVYVRLSKDDRDKIESNSIINQKTIIYEYLKSKSDIIVVSERVDDGYSGTNFDRPAFKEMMKDVENGKINCIIVKDLSRFGRNYIDSGRYLEYDFPKMGVRFIAVTDTCDTGLTGDTSNSIMVPFKNVMNDLYCADISIKTKAILDSKRRKGDYVAAFAPYGYKKDENNKNKLIIDEYAADIVRNIFKYKLKGMSNTAIAKRLNKENILSPLEYKNSIGIKMNNNLKKNEIALWCPEMIRKILQNPVYKGVLEQGKFTKINYRMKTLKKNDKSLWIIIENAHEPIIPEWMFDKVNNLMKMNIKSSHGEEMVHTLAGFLYCSDCGSVLVRNQIFKCNKYYYYFMCPNFKKKKKQCETSHRINESALIDSIIGAINVRIENLIDMEIMIKTIESLKLSEIELENNNNEIIEAERNIKNYQTKLKELPDKLKAGIFDESEYEVIKKTYMSEIANNQNCINKQKKIINNISVNGTKGYSWIEGFKKYSGFKELDRNILSTFIERIIIHEENKIEIKFIYNDDYKEIYSYIKNAYKIIENKNKTDTYIS